MTDFGSQKGAQREPKSNPKPTKIEDKNRCEQNTSSRSSWSRLGTILGHFGSPLGVIFVDFAGVFKGFRENSRFSKNIVSRAVLSPTWPVLGRFWPPKSPPIAEVDSTFGGLEVDIFFDLNSNCRKKFKFRHLP